MQNEQTRSPCGFLSWQSRLLLQPCQAPILARYLRRVFISLFPLQLFLFSSLSKCTVSYHPPTFLIYIVLTVGIGHYLQQWGFVRAQIFASWKLQLLTAPVGLRIGWEFLINITSFSFHCCLCLEHRNREEIGHLTKTRGNYIQSERWTDWFWNTLALRNTAGKIGSLWWNSAFCGLRLLALPTTISC